MSQRAWMVRAGDDNLLASSVETKKAIAVGWWEMGDLAQVQTREDFKKRYAQTYPDHSSSRVNVNAGQVYRFEREIAIGDFVLTYDKSSRELIIGRIKSDPESRPALFGKEYPNIRRVEWIKHVSRDRFSSAFRDSSGSSLTVFNLDDYLVEIEGIVSGTVTPNAVIESPESQVPFHEEIKSRADELIADSISKLDPYEFQDLVAGVLTAMGFRATSSPPGRDRGIDIIAFPDALGFGKPRIKVQVKHRSAPIGGPDMRNFVATIGPDENGLFVSTSGYTNDAIIEADNARSRVTLLDRDKFIELLIEHYEKLDPEYQSQIPLRKVWVPTNV